MAPGKKFATRLGWQSELGAVWWDMRVTCKPGLASFCHQWFKLRFKLSWQKQVSALAETGFCHIFTKT